MRKITKHVASCLYDGANTSMGNTVVTNGAMFLHCNKIAEFKNDVLKLWDAGWQTRTTKDRLEGILEVFCIPARIYQKNNEWYMDFGGESMEWIDGATFENINGTWEILNHM